MHGRHTALRAARHARLPGETRAFPRRIEEGCIAILDGVYTGLWAAGDPRVRSRLVG